MRRRRNAGLTALALGSLSAGGAHAAGAWLDFREIAPGSTSNRALACNVELCPGASQMRPALVFDAPPEDVANALLRLRPDAELMRAPSGDIRARYVAVTRVMRFRDDVDVLIHPEGANRTIVAVYSRSRVGLSDLGANGARIVALERELRAALAR
jgi:uncharacterized protein (DUF1499 family)